MSTKKQKMMKMVRELRQYLGLTQTQFAAELGQGMSTIQRYEQLVPPRGRALAKMIAMAEKAGRKDIAEMLRSGYADEVSDKTAKSWLQLGARAYTELNGTINLIELVTDGLGTGALARGKAVRILQDATRQLRELISTGETEAVPQMQIPKEGDETR
jgi:transcriptional regulator with XRE-family HTH domain